GPRHHNCVGFGVSQAARAALPGLTGSGLITEYNNWGVECISTGMPSSQGGHRPGRLHSEWRQSQSTQSSSNPSHGRTGLVLIIKVLLTLTLGGLGTDLLVVLLKGGEILTCLGELSLFHTLSHIPMHECALGIHEIELVVDAAEGLGDGRRVGNHADGALDAGEVPPGHDGRGLVVDSALEAGGAPVDELDRALRLDGGDGGVDVLGDDVSAVHEAARHVLPVAGVALGHHAGRLEDGVGDLGHGQLLVVGLLSRDDGRVAREHEVDAGVGHQVGLELGDVNVERAVEAEGGGQRRDDLRDEAVEVGVGRALDVEVAAADVVEGLVVEAEGAVGVLEEGVRGQHGVVRLDDGRGHLGRRRDGEAELRLAAVVHREALEEEGPESRPGSSARGVEDEESLEARAVVGELADAVEDEVDDLLRATVLEVRPVRGDALKLKARWQKQLCASNKCKASATHLSNSVVTTGVVVRRVLLPADDLLGVVELPVRAAADLVADRRLQVDVHRAGHVLPGASLGEEGVEGVVSAAHRVVRGHLAVGLDAVLEAVELPAAVTGLDTGLAHVDRDAFCGGGISNCPAA
ncbi:hypothetical protein THAOC_15492, partial [Thalassiosira oceanica]